MWSFLITLFIASFSVNTWAVIESNDILSQTTRVFQEVQNPNVFNAKTCSSYLLARSNYIRTRPYDFYVPKTESEKVAFRGYAKNVTEMVFNLRILLKGKLTEFFNTQSLTEDCTTAVRQAMRVARTTEEMLLIFQKRNNMLPEVQDGKGNATLVGDYPQTFKNPKFYNEDQNVELKSGDLLMMRGAAVVSALIARIGDEDGMFSHIGVYYVEPTTQKKYIIESLIETGLKLTPVEEWQQTVEARVTVYRYPNAEVASNAAQKLYEYYNDYKKAHNGKTVPYDFSMNLSSYDKLFCSEVGRLAYDLGSDGRIKLPTFQTSLNQIKDTNFLKLMGIRSLYIFSPNDMEIEPRFDLVAEFRRLDRLLVLRTQDMAMQATFDWMRDYGYELQESKLDTLKLKFGKALEELGLKKTEMVKDMPIKTLQTMLIVRALHKNILIPYLDKYENEFVEKTGQLPTHADLLLQLDNFRKTDCLNYKNKTGKVLFHQYFRPKNLVCE